ncbi:MAG: SGNH/GDSL hydrolase family protein [Myxococcota bacterium]
MRGSRMHRILVTLLLAAALTSCSADENNNCLPSLFENGTRLHDRNGPNLFALDFIFRQHEICRHHADESLKHRVALLGNSAIFGLDAPTADTVAGLVNQRWRNEGQPLHLYNLGFVTSYLLKDVLIARKAIDHSPDLIVFGVSLSDFIHMAPIPWPEVLPAFFAANEDQLDRVNDEGASGLEELIRTYREREERASWLGQRLVNLREAGSYLRLIFRHRTPAFANRWLLSPNDGQVAEVPAPTESFPTRGPNYRCEKVIAEHEKKFGANWSAWNVFAYLEQLEQIHGVEIAVLDLPIQHDPKGDCYNARFPKRADRQYRDWVRGETTRRGITLWDFHDLLPKSRFEDTIHPTLEGNREVATALANKIAASLAVTERGAAKRE